MQAAVFTGVAEPLAIESVEVAPVGRRDVVVDVGASGVCHSDLSVLNGSRPHPAPAILGHEGAGTVVQVGPDVTRAAVGDRVITSFIPSCGRCFWCLHGQSNLCAAATASLKVPRAVRAGGDEVIAFLGVGSFADQMVVDESSVVPVRTQLPDEQLALLGCGVTTGVCAVLNTARIEAGSTVAVLGCGGVGQAVVQGAVIGGAARIIAVDPVELKRSTAAHLGATDVVDPSAGDAVEAVRALTGGLGVDYAFEAIGLPATIAQAFGMARRGGAAIVVGMPRFDSTVTLPAFQLFTEEKRVMASKYGSAQVRRDFQRLIDLAEAGRLDLASLVSRRVGLAGVNDAFRAMESGEVIRSVIV